MCLADHDAVAWFKEDEDGESVWDDVHSPPAQQEFSLLDLAMATRHKRHQKPMENLRKAAKGTETVLVNSASNQRVKKYAKGSAVFIEKEEEEDVGKDAGDDFDFMQKMAAEADTDGDSGLHSDAESGQSPHSNFPLQLSRTMRRRFPGLMTVSALVESHSMNSTSITFRTRLDQQWRLGSALRSL